MPPMTEETIRTVSSLATQLGNQISVHMLNLLSTTKELPEGFRELSHTFLDTCRILWAIEAGVTELAAANRTLPTVIIDEVEKKFISAYRDFQSLDKIILKLVQYEHRGTLGKIQRGWNRPGQELNRIQKSLSQTAETLQISGMAFHWSLGEAHPEESVGIGYASLAAALDRIAKGRSVMGVTKDGSENNGSVLSVHRKTPVFSPSVPPVPPKEPPNLISNRRYSPSEQPRPELLQHDDHESIADDMSSVVSLNSFFRGQPARETETPTSIDYRTLHPMPAKTSSAAPSVAEVGIRHDSDSDTDLGHLMKTSLPALDALPLPQRGMGNVNLRNSLALAIRGRNHSMIEHLLTNGASPDKLEHFHPLNEAAHQCDSESMRLLLLFKANPNIPDSDGKPPLLLSVEKSFVEGVMLLLQSGADPNYRAKPELESPLSFCIFNSNIRLMQTLLAHGGNLKEEMCNGTTLLIEVIRRRATQQLVKILLDGGCDPNKKDDHGKTALCEAVQSDQSATLSTLLDYHANPNLPGPTHALWSAVDRPDCLRILLVRGGDIRKTPGLMEKATSMNKFDAVNVLLQAGIDPNSKKDGVYTPLCSAIRDDRPDLLALLLSHGADPNLMASEYPAWKCITHNRLQFLPELVAAGANLHQPPGIAELAVQENNFKGLQWVVEQGGANPNDRNERGHTALTTALRENRLEMLDWLLVHGADPNLRGQDWPIFIAARSPELMKRLLPHITDIAAHKGVMEKAVQANQLENIKLLLAAGASIEWKNGGVFSCLTTALRERHTELVHFLLNEANADPNAPGEHLPLVKAIRRCDDGDFSMIELLLAKGADPNKCYRDWNAIMQAIEDRDIRLLQLLVEKGGQADLTKKDETGQTVLEMADNSGWQDGTQLLLKNSRQ
ncbi:hypothetical protein N7495_000014 [Penicillium taxi]|uniref:uncharacterized protein n=1 Tax=Penicillium taxi TaxID=168475 RepID=UPI002545A45C|nr:uncharacterized protein N7495_000014 [Penicillium taxi]KAJ5907332.1 hypothetical protein N7495_000014 [Penicillium taxi]